ncbi:MAG: 4Fe-4S dicluster domain-containing protein [Chloroflexota bacterium]|nr:4Fe-4S dicluster domain-containing protein [Chloroflexota bacterium]
MTRAMLIDLNKCIGCRGCQAACKQWHDLPAEMTTNNGSYQNPPAFSDKTYTVVTFNEVEYDERFYWMFAKRQCMHCEHPGCASACTVGALQKTAEGPVVYDSSKCIGCRYCQYACPFGVPTFEWQETLGLIRKCDFCVDRTGDGMAPACAKACPTGAIQFGERDVLLAEAHHRIATQPHKYINHIYGEHEVGGTSMLYLSGVPFAALGFPKLGEQPVSEYAEKVMGQTPTVAVGVAAIAAGLWWVIKRREENMRPVAVLNADGKPTADEEVES